MEDKIDTKYTPVYRPVNSKEPSELDKRIDNNLKLYMDVEMKLESDEEMKRRDSVLSEVRKIFIKWVRHIAVNVLHMPEDEEDEIGGELFISGSHRLGVRDVGADIDTVCVAPNFCTREHFFTYLKDELMKHPDVTELNAVEEAFVPMIGFDFQGVSIDLLFARLADNAVPKDLDILDDKILTGLDVTAEKSLNGPRVTNMIVKLVGEKAFPNFLIVLRCIRKWAKKRGLYGNKLGYLGGVNCNILVAFLCQLYPNAGPSSLILRFFKLYSDWKWPDPIMLNGIQDNAADAPLSEQRDVWSADKYPHHVMPIITPAYPAMNSSVNVSPDSLEVMRREFVRGYEVTKQVIQKGGRAWGDLFEYSDFFIRYSHYLACHIIGTGEDAESRSWIGFVESRIRRFVLYPFLERLPLKRPVQLFPVMSKTQKSPNSVCYFIGFDLDLETISKMQDKNIYIDDCAYRFQESLLDPERGYRGIRKDGLDFFVEHMSWKKLPTEVFEAYGGRDTAKMLRAAKGFGKTKTKDQAEDNKASSLPTDTVKTETGLAGDDSDMNGSAVIKEELNGKRKLDAVEMDEKEKKYKEIKERVLEMAAKKKPIPVLLASDMKGKALVRPYTLPNVVWNLVDDK